jgi:enamine deaminase RidA (YjgF/YER057c/UK114 family)
VSAEERVRQLGLRLPEAAAPAHNYVAVVQHGGIAWVAGQIPRDGQRVLFIGKCGADITLDQAREAARACVVAGLAQLRAALGTLDRVRRVLKVTGFVASAAGFNQQPQVMDAASDLLVDVFGEAGRHARSAVGVAELPRGVPVEVEMVVAIEP